MANQRNSARRRTKRRGRRREPHTGFTGKILILLAVVAAIVLGVAIFFRVRTVDVQGNSIYSKEQVVSVSGVEPGDNLLTLNRSSVTANIKVRLPYVQEVSVGLILPDTVVIQVQESDLACLVTAENGGNWYLNTDGRVLGSSVDDFTGQVVELTGFTIRDPQLGQDAVASEEQNANLAAALEIVQQMEGTGLIEQVTTVNAEKIFDIELWCGEQYQILLGGTEEMEYKISYLKAVLEQLEPYQAGVIDLTFDAEREARFVPWTIEG